MHGDNLGQAIEDAHTYIPRHVGPNLFWELLVLPNRLTRTQYLENLRLRGLSTSNRRALSSFFSRFVSAARARLEEAAAGPEETAALRIADLVEEAEQEARARDDYQVIALATAYNRGNLLGGGRRTKRRKRRHNQSRKKKRKKRKTRRKMRRKKRRKKRTRSRKRRPKRRTKRK